MRILQIIAGLHRIGGTTTFAGELSNALAAQGEDVTMAMFRIISGHSFRSAGPHRTGTEKKKRRCYHQRPFRGGA